MHKQTPTPTLTPAPGAAIVNSAGLTSVSMTASTKSLDYPGCTSSDASGTISKIYLTSLELGPTHTSFPTFISLVYEYHARSSKSWTLRPSFTRGVRCHTWALPTGGLHHNVEVRILPSAPPSKPNLVHLNKSGRGCLCGMRRVRGFGSMAYISTALSKNGVW